MVNIQRSRLGKNIIIFSFDKTDVLNFHAGLLKCRSNDFFSVQVEFNFGKGIKISELKVIHSNSEFFNLIENPKILAIDRETIDHGIYLLNYYLYNNEFPIPEFCNIDLIKKRKIGVQILFYSSMAKMI